MTTSNVEQLSKEQQEVVDANGKVILRACPGSGKTYTVSRKLYKKLNNWSQQTSGIAVLSFTNVACEEINNQIIKLGIDKGVRFPHFLGTLDHFINTYIFLPFGHLVMKCNKRPRIVGLGSSVWEQSTWKNAQCNKMRCNIIDFTYDKDGNLINLNPNIDMSKCNLNLEPCNNYKRYFVNNGYANQSDANYWAMLLLERYPIISKIIARKFQEIIIDEAQDTSQIQMRIIDSLIDNGVKNITVVGDPDQAIFEWRQAMPQLFIEKMENQKWNLIELLKNRRSSQVICNATYIFSNTLINAPEAVGETKNYSRKPIMILYNEKQDKDSKLLDVFNQLKNKYIELCEIENIPIDSKSVSILCRTDTVLKRVLNIDNVINPWNHSFTKLLAEAAYYRDINNIKDSLNSVNTVICKICFGNSYLQEYELIKLLSGSMSIGEWKRKVYMLMKSLPDSEQPLNKWVEQCKGVIIKWIDENNFQIKDENACTLKIKSRINGCKDYKERSIKSYFEKVSKDNITVETIHAAKGKTYEASMIVLSSKSKKGSVKQIAELPLNDEEIRTFYVGITRPRKLLVIALPSDTKAEYMLRFNSNEWEKITL